MVGKVELSNGVVFENLENKTILASALEQEVILEHSCKTGKCGVCRAKVLSGEAIVSQNIEESLSEIDKEEGYILTCCRSAKDNVSLDIEDIGFLKGIETQVLPCRIDNMEQLSTDVLQIALRLPPTANFKYLAGQYIDLLAKGIRRSYSISNAPDSLEGKIVLEIRQVVGGQMSSYLFNHAKKNDLLRIEGPLGTFCLRESVKKPLFIATGTGIAPIKAMVETLPEGQKATIYWGMRGQEDIYWKDVPENVDLIPVLSQADNSWSGRRGYVQNAVVEENIDLSQYVVYACGSIKMISEAKDLFINHGLLDQCFYSDAFVPSF